MLILAAGGSSPYLSSVGGGGQGNLDKIQKNSYFFRESVPERGNWWWSKWWCAPSARPVSAPHPLVDVKP